ncbi:hypothetical protein AB0469_38265 [Streptomyces sp. NPDC093801]|uniref:hypothetical protein n=1 Tax=Streptomyces sp. NPDC093801 TaxID=3155203 RepID=UPI00344EA368
MDGERSYGRMLVVSALVGCLEVALAVVVVLLYVRTQPPPDSPVDHTALVAGLFSLGGLVGAAALLLSAVFVLPAVALAGRLGRPTGRSEAWWVPPAVAALAAPPIAVFAAYGHLEVRGVLAFWAVAAAVLSAGGLVARLRHPRLVRRTALWGAALVAGTGLAGVLGFATGLLPAYQPPAIGAAAVPGTWADRTGGTLVFTADGRVTASGVGEHAPDDPPAGPSRRCSGSGTWSYAPGRDVRSQEVRVAVPGCSWTAWSVGGTARTPRIHRPVGPPDSGKRYELRKAAGGS